MTSKEYIDKKRDQFYPLRKYMKFGLVGHGGSREYKKWVSVTKAEKQLFCIASSISPSITYGLFRGTFLCQILRNSKFHSIFLSIPCAN